MGLRRLLDRAVAGYRRTAGAPDLPYAAAAVTGVAALIEVALRASGQQNTSLMLVFALAMTLPIALVGAQPVLAALLITVAALTTLFMGASLPLAGVAALLGALYLAGRSSSWQTCILLIGPYAGYAFTPLSDSAPGGKAAAIGLLVLTCAATSTGLAQRAYAENAERDASVRAMADTLLEHAARGERARIARELHDVVAHHISMVAVQAEAARLTTPGMPAEGAKRLIAIGDTARAALNEMRRLLGVLREDTSLEPPRRPQPGLQQLNELLDEARKLAGGSTRLIVSGRIRPLDPGVELTAYRIVQEALTNVRRHARGAGVDVELEYDPHELRVSIRDNGPGWSSDKQHTGHGLTGMRERAAMVGGTLTVGPAPLGGFLIEAVLPTEGDAG